MSKRKEPEHVNGDHSNGKRSRLEHEQENSENQTSSIPSSSTAMSQIANRAAVTKPAPEFKQVDALLPNGEFGKLSLADFQGKWLVLFFYPLDFTFVCPTEIIDFSERSEEFRKLGAEVVGASIDSKFSHLAWTQQPRNKGGLGPMKIPLIADVDRSLSRDYGVLMDPGFTLRGLFIIDPKGEIKHATLNHPDVGRNVDEVLRVLQAYQYAAVHGEVCPSGWKPGQTGMKPDPKGSQAYFQAANK